MSVWYVRWTAGGVAACCCCCLCGCVSDGVVGVCGGAVPIVWRGGGATVGGGGGRAGTRNGVAVHAYVAVVQPVVEVVVLALVVVIVWWNSLCYAAAGVDVVGYPYYMIPPCPEIQASFVH